MSFDVVIPTTGRDSLASLLHALSDADGLRPGRVLVVDDRRDRSRPLPTGPGASIVRGPGRGPAAARNAGWRQSQAEWVSFLDDDVVPSEGWLRDLVGDLRRAGPRVAGSQGRVRVPLPHNRRATDWERNTAGLGDARWATADMAYRRAALAEVSGFDERFVRAYREDADLGLRLTARGWEVVRGERRVLHPVRPAGRWVSLRMQAGNADDVLMRALHGPAWRAAAGAPRGRLRRHLATTAAGAAGAALLAAGSRRTGRAALAGWLAGSAELAWARIAPGPRDRDEVLTMLVTSLAMPPVATWHWLRGHARARRLVPGRPGARPAVLLDRDGTLIDDVPYNGDPQRVRPLPGAREALDRLRAAGVPLAVVSNQSAVGRGLVSPDQLGAVNARVEELLGPLGPWLICPHAPDDGCDCRKPRPGLVLRAARRLGVRPEDCVLVGDIGADVEAARAAGARAVLVPTSRTREEEVAAAPATAPDLRGAVDLVLEAAA